MKSELAGKVSREVFEAWSAALGDLLDTVRFIFL